MAVYIAPARPAVKKQSVEKKKKVSALPSVKDGEQKQKYVFGINPNQKDVFTLTLLGIAFHRSVAPTSASLVSSSEEEVSRGFQAIELSESQLKALKEAIAEREIALPRRKNWKEDKWEEPATVAYSDLLYVVPEKEFNPTHVGSLFDAQDSPAQAKVGKTEIDKVSNAIYEAQASKKTKG